MSNKFAIYDLPSNQRESLTVFDAAERGDVKVLTKLSKVKGFDVNSKDKFGRTALMWAADCGQVRYACMCECVCVCIFDAMCRSMIRQ